MRGSRNSWLLALMRRGITDCRDSIAQTRVTTCASEEEAMNWLASIAVKRGDKLKAGAKAK